MRNRLYFFILCIVAISCDETRKPAELKTLVSPTDSLSAEPHLFTDNEGAVFLSWIEKKNDSAKFLFSKLAADKWSEPKLIAKGNTWFVNWADYPMLASGGKGNLVAHLLDKSGKGTYAYDIKMYTSGNEGKSWNTPFILHDDGKQAEHGFVTMVPFEDKIFVTWLDGRNTVMEGMEDMKGMDHEGHHGAMSLRAAIVGYDGKKTGEWELDDKTCDCCQTTAAITDNGPVVIYRDRSDEEIRDMSIVRLVNNEWTRPVAIHNDNWKIAGCPVNGPRAAASGNQLAIAWFSAATDTTQVNVIFSTDGGATFGKPVRVDEGKAIGRVDVVLLDKESAMVSWMEGVMVKAVVVYMNGKKESSIEIAASSDSRSSGFPQMTRSGDRMIFAWTDNKEKRIKVTSLSL